MTNWPTYRPLTHGALERLLGKHVDDCELYLPSHGQLTGLVSGEGRKGCQIRRRSWWRRLLRYK